MAKHYDIFWKALVITLIVFLLGVALGYVLENNRLNEIEFNYLNFELEWSDAKLQNFYYNILDKESCESAITENLKFADDIYQEGLKIEDYEEVNFLTNKIVISKKKYALLKVEFWLNSMILKNKCNADYYNLVYFFSNNPEYEVEAKQNAQSKILKELKDKYGRNLMLIPLPIDLDISMINIITSSHNITTTPTLLIDEKFKLEGLQSIEDIEQYINTHNKSFNKSPIVIESESNFFNDLDLFNKG